MPDRCAEALSQVLELVVVLGDDMARGLARTGLTVPRATLLWELRVRGPSTQRALADALDVSARTVTGLVDGLTATGFVTREPHSTDRRAVSVTLTAKGHATAEALAEGRSALGAQLFGDLPEARLTAFTAEVAALVERLRAAIREDGE